MKGRSPPSWNVSMASFQLGRIQSELAVPGWLECMEECGGNMVVVCSFNLAPGLIALLGEVRSSNRR